MGGGQFAKPRRTFPPGFWPWWRSEVAKRNLRDPLDVEELYGLGVAAGLYAHTPDNRLQVFIQAAHDFHLAPNPGAYFRNNVARCDWAHANCYDQDVGARMLAAADLGDSDPVTVPTTPKAVADPDGANDPIVIPTDLEIPDANAAEQHRQDQKNALNEWVANRRARQAAVQPH